jgi:hypothetical protein
VHGNRSSDRVQTGLGVEYTGRPVSGWGGLILVVRFLDAMGLRAVLARALPDGRRSPNQIPVVDMVLGVFATVLTGGRRFSHVERIRHDEVVRGILGVRRIPSAMSLTRYFGGFVQSQVDHVAEVLGRWVMQRAGVRATGEVLDLDSTVFERYGRQEGSLKGHNPRKHGRPSHHPLLAMLASAKLVAHAWLRSGNAGTARGVNAFLAETLARLPSHVVLRAIRADSGFFETDFLDELDRRRLDYAIAVRMNRLVHREIVGISQWRPFGLGLEVASIPYQAYKWERPRRLVVVREEIRTRPEARGRRLFDLPDYTVHGVVTSLTDPPEDVWRFYNGRAESENRLKELKYDYGADGFCLQSFFGTEAVFRLLCVLFNILAQFKHSVLLDDAPQLGTVRHSTFVIGAILGTKGRHRVLRLGLRGRWRERFATLLARITALLTVTPILQPNQLQSLQCPRAWQPRRRKRPNHPAQPLLFQLN